ncbi:MAG: PQQ-binding-like beta-propeller repeat protein [Pirellulales bacterium]
MTPIWRLLLTGAALSFLAASVSAEDWPGWRGPRGDGGSQEEHIPTTWDGTTGNNIAWKVEIPGSGHGSPIVWQDRIFLATCLEDSEDRALLCLDRASGQPLWQQTVVHAPLEKKHRLNSFASGTPATDGKLVYVTFLDQGEMAVAAYDFSGEQRWLVRPGKFSSIHGYSSCPVLFEDKLIVNGDHDGDSYIVALSRETGETLWKVDREHKTRSYVTPLIRQIDGRTQMLVSGSKCITSYDPHDGSMHWRIDGPTEQFVASMVYNGKLLFMTAGFPDHHILAIRPDGEGNVTDTHIAWRTQKGASYVPSPVAVGEYFLVVSDGGVANCFLAETGERMWTERLGSHYSASLVTAGGLVYFLDDLGITKVVKPGRQLEVLAENPLGENCYASPAISGGQILIRSTHHLQAIGK